MSKRAQRREKAEAIDRCRHQVSRVLLDMDQDINEARGFLEAIHMMAMDLAHTPDEDATAAFRTVAQAAINHCAKLREQCDRAIRLSRSETIAEAVGFIEAGDSA